MSDKTIILDQPDQILAFGLLQIYFKLKLEVELPDGPRWRVSPLGQAWQILADNDIHVRRRRVPVFEAYGAFLREKGILKDNVTTRRDVHRRSASSVQDLDQ